MPVEAEREKGQELICLWVCARRQNWKAWRDRVKNIITRGVSGNKFYKVTFITHPSRASWTIHCTCLAYGNEDSCKHKCALFCALVALRDFGNKDTLPKALQRVGAKRFQVKKGIDDWCGLPPFFIKEARLNLSWPDIVQQLRTPLPTHEETSAGKKRKLNKIEVVEKKKRKKKLYCYCNEEESGKEMIHCQGGSSACKSSWYHIQCIEKNEKIVLERTPKGGVRGSYICRLCQTLNAMKAK